MYIHSLILTNFRCFGGPTTIVFDPITALVGRNGSGKTAVLQALTRMFGVSSGERRVQAQDFHLSPGTSLEDQEERTLSLEANIVFPALEERESAEEDPGIPLTFSNMVVGQTNGSPYCRIRLEAIFRRGTIAEGDIEEQIFWITTAEETYDETQKRRLKPFERESIQVIYLPASRDPERQIRNVTGTLIHRILRAVRWSEDLKSKTQKYAERIQQQFTAEEAIKRIDKLLASSWKHLHDESTYVDPHLSVELSTTEKLLRTLEVEFLAEEGQEIPAGIDRLSDGWKSLFYFALVNAIFSLEKELLTQTAEESEEDQPFAVDQLHTPALVLFAVEEPENHLSPHYLGRIMRQLRRLAKGGSQVALTSHSAGIMNRIKPREVRYFRLKAPAEADVRALTLPEPGVELSKYVNAAIRAYPELYFARVIILCEGDSEQIVLPRIAAANNFDVDPNFVSVVPLGGRHVNHFWRLLTDLRIPFVTLLDLDWERTGGGWNRIHYAISQLQVLGYDLSDFPEIGEQKLNDALEEMQNWSTDEFSTATPWLEALEQFGIFFSSPLDLDFAMLQSFSEQYKSSANGQGPRIPSTATRRQEYLGAAIDVVLGDGATGESYEESDRELFPWYRFLFLNQSKPATHIEALSTLSKADLKNNVPGVLLRLIESANEAIKAQTEHEEV